MDLQWQADKAKTPPDYELVEINQVLVVGKAHLSAYMMHFLVRILYRTPKFAQVAQTSERQLEYLDHESWHT